MVTTIKARFSNGILKPLEALELSEGEEVAVTIVTLPCSPSSDWLERTAGGWVGLVDMDKLERDIYESRQLSTRPKPEF